jgi:hypothetical protein
MSLITTKKNYNKAKSIYNEIDNDFNDLQSGEKEESEFILNQIINKLKLLKKHLRYIDLDDIKDNYEQKTIDAVMHNVNFIEDAAYYWERFFLQSKLNKELLDPLRLKYIPELHLAEEEKEKIGKNDLEIAKKFIGAAAHPDNIKEYEKALKRIALGTMTQQEFKRIFDVIKHKMLIKKSFQSLSNYKKENNES